MHELNKLSGHIPDNALPYINQFVEGYSVCVVVSGLRHALGKFQVRPKLKLYRIVMQKGLSKPLFLFVLLHEIAHLRIYFRHRRTVKPHGIEWREEYKSLLLNVLPSPVFPPDISARIYLGLSDPRLKFLTDPDFIHCFEDFNDTVSLYKLPVNTRFFAFPNRTMKLVQNINDWEYVALDLKNDRKYIIKGSFRVKPMQGGDLPTDNRRTESAEQLELYFPLQEGSL